MASPTFAQIRGRMIRRLRDAVGLTQEELAAKAGYTGGGRVALSKVEQGQAAPTPDRLLGICDALGISVEELEHRTAVELVNGPRFTDTMLVPLAGPEAADNARRERVLAHETERLTRVTQSRFAAAKGACDDARDNFVVPFLELAARVRDLPAATGHPVPLGPGVDVDGLVRVSVQELAGVTMGTMTALRLANGLGQGLARPTAEAVYAAVGAIATSSTGTRISALSGAARDSATRAWLGRGSIASNGGGMAAGDLALRRIALVPLLLSAAAAVALQMTHARMKARTEAARLTEAERTLEDARPEFEQAWAWADEQRVVLAALTAEGVELIAELDASVPADGDVAWNSLGKRAQELLVRALDFVSMVVTIEALSIWSMVSTEETRPVPGAARVNAAWIAAVLRQGRDLARRPGGGSL